eukprot:scaffold11173_cov99-Skeletonema_menzelii.AAC.1
MITEDLIHWPPHRGTFSSSLLKLAGSEDVHNLTSRLSFELSKGRQFSAGRTPLQDSRPTKTARILIPTLEM